MRIAAGGCGLGMVYAAKSRSFAGAERLINLNAVTEPEELLPLLESVPDREQREAAARSDLRIPRALAAAAQCGRARPLRVAPSGAARCRWRSSSRSSSCARRAEFRDEFLLWAALYFAGFYLVALVWRWHALSAATAPFCRRCTCSPASGFILMASMRDPLRDTLEFHKFALGVFLGCLLLALPAFPAFDYRRLSDWCYTPLFAALGLFGLLLRFGRGPAGNDAKVNLGPFQPVELIKILLVLFLAGYFTRHWERLRDLREKRVLRRIVPAHRPAAAGARGAGAVRRRPSRWCCFSC